MYNETIAETFGSNSTAWTILKSDVKGNTPWRGRSFVRDERNGQWLCGDRQGANVGIIDERVCTQYGAMVEWELFTPLLKLETKSIDYLEMETIPGEAPDHDATVFFSRTEDARTYSQEWSQLYGQNHDYNQRFIKRHLGYVRHWVGLKFRGASKSRMSFAFLNIEVS